MYIWMIMLPDHMSNDKQKPDLNHIYANSEDSYQPVHLHLRCMLNLFSSLLQRETTFGTSCLPLDDVALPKWGYSQTKESAPKGANSLL